VSMRRAKTSNALGPSKKAYVLAQTERSAEPSNSVGNEVGLDVRHHTRISQRGGEQLFFLTSLFIGCV
jgi:hypothetical protein